MRWMVLKSVPDCDERLHTFFVIQKIPNTQTHNLVVSARPQAVAAQDVFVKEDDAEDEEDERLEETQALAAKPKPLEQGGGMYFWERMTLGFQKLRHKFNTPSPLPAQPKKS